MTTLPSLKPLPPVRDCILCGCPTRADVGIVKQREAGVTFVSLPLCNRHGRFKGINAAERFYERAVGAGASFPLVVIRDVNSVDDLLMFLGISQSRSASATCLWPSKRPTPQTGCNCGVTR